jgi:excisionase family DNA binding protein
MGYNCIGNRQFHSKREERKMEKALGRFLSVEGLSDELGVSRTTIYKWVQSKFIPHYRMGTKIGFDKEEVLDWAKKRGSNGRKRTENVNQYA